MNSTFILFLSSNLFIQSLYSQMFDWLVLWLKTHSSMLISPGHRMVFLFTAHTQDPGKKQFDSFKNRKKKSFWTAFVDKFMLMHLESMPLLAWMKYDDEINLHQFTTRLWLKLSSCCSSHVGNETAVCENCSRRSYVALRVPLIKKTDSKPFNNNNSEVVEGNSIKKCFTLSFSPRRPLSLLWSQGANVCKFLYLPRYS